METLEEYLFALFKQPPCDVEYEDGLRMGRHKVFGTYEHDTDTIYISDEQFHTRKGTTQLATLLHELGHRTFKLLNGDEEKIVERYATIIEKLLNENI